VQWVRVDRNRAPDVLELCALSTDILKPCVPQSGTRLLSLPVRDGLASVVGIKCLPVERLDCRRWEEVGDLRFPERVAAGLLFESAIGARQPVLALS
jgi:hypothetical protein